MTVIAPQQNIVRNPTRIREDRSLNKRDVTEVEIEYPSSDGMPMAESDTHAFMITLIS